MYTILDYANRYIKPQETARVRRQLHEADELDSEHFKVEILDVESFIKANEVQEITDPIFFVRNNVPTSNGLLSNEIFGITKEERSNIYGYIALHDTFIHPLCYSILCKLDRRIKECVHETKRFSLDSNGYMIEDENGKTGIKFLKDNIDKIKFKRSESRKRDNKLAFIEKNKSKMFLNKYIVIPAFYRDVTSSEGYVGVGKINKLYQSLIIGVRSLSEAKEYGFDISGATKGRVQETLLAIYDWFSGNTNASISDSDSGTGMSGKYGIMQQAALSKTTDYSTRLVLSAYNLKVESLDDMLVDIDHCLLPLASALVNFYPFILFNVRRFFQNEFEGENGYPVYTNGKITYEKLKEPLIEFSDERVAEEIKRFVHGYSNRFIPVTVTLENGKSVYMQFKGYKNKVNPNSEIIDKIPEVIDNDSDKSFIGRRLTWLDVFYIAACESVKDKNIIVTRYPMDSCYNQMFMKPIISSTNETEQLYYNGEYYPIYPKIRDKDIGTNTSNMFIDTLIMSNLLLKGCGGDYKLKPIVVFLE